jgi:DNA-binding XRE family transcriptional regulator
MNDEVVALATLPPSKMARKITRLQNKLVNENEKRVAAETKCSDKNIECKMAQQQLRQEKRASNTLIDIEKEKAAEVLEAARAMKEVSEVTVESVMEQMTAMTIECEKKIREERQHWSAEREKLLAKQKNERSGHVAIIEHLKNRHLHELEKINKRFAKQLQEQRTLLEKEQHHAILRGVRARQRELLQEVSHHMDKRWQEEIDCYIGSSSYRNH